MCGGRVGIVQEKSEGQREGTTATETRSQEASCSPWGAVSSSALQALKIQGGEYSEMRLKTLVGMDPRHD